MPHPMERRKLGLGVVVTTLCGLLAVMACDSDEGGEGGEGGGTDSGGAGTTGGGGKVTAADYDDRLVAAYCHGLFTCPLPPDDDVLFLPALLLNEDNCVAYFGERIERTIATRDLARKLAAGELAFSEQNAALCLDGYASCANLGRGVLEACYEVFDGKVALGGECSRNEDCEGSAYCAVKTCPGICTAKLPLGSECEDSRECAQSAGLATCVWTGASANCASVVAGTGTLGGPCDVESAAVEDRCQEGLFCNEDSGLSTGTCTAPIPAGEDCDDPDDVCADRLTACLSDSNGAGKCGTITLVKEAGEACNERGAGQLSMCDPVLMLECVDSICVQLGDGSEGSRCSNSDSFEQMCDDGLYCSETTEPPSCQPRLAVGALCESQAEGACEWGCDEASRTCAAGYCQGF